VTGAVLAGLLGGVGIWWVWTGLHPAPEPLGAALARVRGRPVELPVIPDGVDERDLRIGRFFLRHLPVLARAVERARVDLRVVGRTPEEHAARVGLYVMIGLAAGPWFGLVASLAGGRLPLAVPALMSLGGAAWAAVAPFLRLRRDARERREAFAHALSAWCDVVVMSLAAGRGVEQAMETAAAAGQGWAFAELRGAMHGGYVRADTPWEALGLLGSELGIPDLSELASTMALAGEEGAAVRTTVAAKARTIRERITAETEQRAAAVTEQMGLPNVLLVLGFLVFLAFPAVMVMFQHVG
jgi:tight adherence protein C